MTKITETSPNSPSRETNQNLSWWKRPVMGEGSILEALLGGQAQEDVSESALMLHNREMMDIKVFAKTAEAIDSEKFGSEEFLQFVRLKYAITRDLDEYKGLDQSIELLKVAIDAKDSFISIDQTELRYRGTKQQDFYQYVEDLLNNETTRTDEDLFRERVTAQLDELLPQVKTEEGRTALQAYAHHLDTLSESRLGLKLLALFKTYQLADYSILKIISDIIQGLNKKDLMNLKGIESLVIINYQVFEKLRKIIGISASQHKPETYALILQYIALSYRHGLSYLKFDELINILKKWSRHYHALNGIRSAHPSEQYKQPQEFSDPIPGIAIYEKYKKSLTNPKTGMAYVDFGEGAI